MSQFTSAHNSPFKNQHPDQRSRTMNKLTLPVSNQGTFSNESVSDSKSDRSRRSKSKRKNSVNKHQTELALTVTAPDNNEIAPVTKKLSVVQQARENQRRKPVDQQTFINHVMEINDKFDKLHDQFEQLQAKYSDEKMQQVLQVATENRVMLQMQHRNITDNRNLIQQQLQNQDSPRRHMSRNLNDLMNNSANLNIESQPSGPLSKQDKEDQRRRQKEKEAIYDLNRVGVPPDTFEQFRKYFIMREDLTDTKEGIQKQILNTDKKIQDNDKIMSRHFNESINQFKSLKDTVTQNRQEFENQMHTSLKRQANDNKNFRDSITTLQDELAKLQGEKVPQIIEEFEQKTVEIAKIIDDIKKTNETFADMELIKQEFVAVNAKIDESFITIGSKMFPTKQDLMKEAQNIFKLQKEVQENDKIFLSFKKELDLISKEVNSKLGKSDVIEFQRLVKDLPNLDQFREYEKRMCIQLADTREHQTNMEESVKKHLEIIARYDEVISSKAQKHSIKELQVQIDKIQSNKAGSDTFINQFINETKEQIHTLIKEVNMNHDDYLNLKEKVRVSFQNLKELEDTDVKFKAVNSKVSKKLNVDDFEKAYSTKANQSDVELIYDQLQVLSQNAIHMQVLQNECLRLHQTIPDETQQQRQNRVVQLVGQVQKVMNTAETSKNQDFVSSLIQAQMGGLGALQQQNHNVFPVSPRFKRSIMQKSEFNSQLSNIQRTLTSSQISSGQNRAQKIVGRAVSSNNNGGGRYATEMRVQAGGNRTPSNERIMLNNKLVTPSSGAFLMQNQRAMSPQIEFDQTIVKSQDGSLKGKYQDQRVKKSYILQKPNEI